MKQPAVYILASKRNGTLYIGVTSDLPVRVWQHRNDIVEGFTKKHGVHMLGYFELHDDMETAITRDARYGAFPDTFSDPASIMPACRVVWHEVAEDLVDSIDKFFRPFVRCNLPSQFHQRRR